jgi:hypothetical protein
VLGIAVAACVVALMILGSHFNFFVDEWRFALYRRGWTPSDFLEPHTGHLVLVSVTIYKVLFELVGMSHMWPYRLTLALFHVAVVVIVYAIAAKRLGSWLALFPAGLMLLPGDAHDDLLWPFQICFLGSVAFGLGAMLCLDRETRRGDIAAAVLVGLSLASSAVGVPFALGILAELWLTRERGRRLFVALAPLGLFGLWLLGFYTSENELRLSNLPDLPGFVVRIAGEGFAGFASLPEPVGIALLLAAAAWLAWFGFRRGGLPARSVGAIVAALAFWGLTGIARAQISENYPSRYVYVSMALILVALIPTLPRKPKVTRPVAGVLAAIVAAAIVAGLGPIGDYIDLRKPHDEVVVADASAEWIAHVEGDPYLDMYADLDFPLASDREIMRMPLTQRQSADETVARADGIALEPPGPRELDSATPARVPEWHSLTKSLITVDGLRCTRLTATAPDALAAMPVPVGHGLLFVAQTAEDPQIGVRVRRFSNEYLDEGLSVPPGLLDEPGSAAVVRFPRDLSEVGWWARLEFTGPIGLCLT